VISIKRKKVAKEELRARQNGRVKDIMNI